MQKIMIIGGGFAGVWSALGAARLRRIHNKESSIEITLINKDDFHGIRPRYYEQDLSEFRVPLADILTPYGIKLHIGNVIHIDYEQQHIQLENTASTLEMLAYDRLILAAGSHLHTPPVPGLSTYGFNVDTYAATEHLAEHLRALPRQPTAKGKYTIVVVGGGFTGVEAATDLIDRIRRIAPNKAEARVIVIDHSEIASTLGTEPQQVIHQAFRDLHIETKTNTHVINIEKDHIQLESGERIDTHTVVWTAGMRSNALTHMFPATLDRFGRLPVDAFLRMPGVKHCFAAGDVAAALTDGTHYALQSCQHAMPQGRVAGHNVVADLLGEALIPYEQKKFVVSIDLGSWGALYAEGWEQKVLEQGKAAKKIKFWINHERIYPPTDGNMETLLYVAAPVFREIPAGNIGSS